MGAIIIDGTSWSLEPVPWMSFDEFVRESSWAYRKYAEVDRLTLLKKAYNYIHGEVEGDEQSHGFTGEPGESRPETGGD